MCTGHKNSTRRIVTADMQLYYNICIYLNINHIVFIYIFHAKKTWVRFFSNFKVRSGFLSYDERDLRKKNFFVLKSRLWTFSENTLLFICIARIGSEIYLSVRNIEMFIIPGVYYTEIRCSLVYSENNLNFYDPEQTLNPYGSLFSFWKTV